MARQQFNGMQGQWVKAQLIAGESIAQPDLLKACGGRGGWRMAAHIHRLRREGWPIESRPMPNPGPDTDLNPPVTYQLQPGWKAGSPVQQELLI